jgi:iron complex outermembrane receptor protein
MSSAVDLGPLGASFSNTWELGYKGVFGEKFRLAVDYWYQVRPAEPTTQLIPQVVFYNPTNLASFLGVPAALPATLGANGVPGANIAAVVTGFLTTVGGIPAGVLNMDHPNYDQSYLVFTYKNATGQVDVRGLDVGMDYLLNDAFTLEGTWSYLARTIFPRAPGATAANPLAANAPKNRITTTLRWANAMRSMSSEFRIRHYSKMLVNSGVYNSYNINTPVPYGAVPANTFVDAGFNWRLPFAQNVRWAVNAQNLLNNEVPSFIGVPDVGRLITTRLQYTF